MKLLTNAPILIDDTKRLEKVLFRYIGFGDVEVEVPVITCKKTNKQFFHPDDIDSVLEALDKAYKLIPLGKS